jgi:tetratricopeptide (TPR) repeat protein
MIAERDGQWILARSYAERAKSQFEQLSDNVIVGRLLNNLGLLELLLGKPDQAVARLNEAFSTVLDTGDDDELATVISSLSLVSLRTGDPASAEKHARHALTVLGAREDRTEEIGSVHLTLGRALLELGRFEEAEEALAMAEDAFAQLSSGSHSAAAWLAQGDLAQRRGDDSGAATLFRRSAEALQDYRL